MVAFKEAKASYVKDWTEVQEKLHPKTVQLLEHAGVRSILAVPLTCGRSQFVLTLLSPQSEPPKEPGVMKVIEATEAIFDAAITVLDQKTSVLALGKLATRLIGDDDIREKIVSAAKEDTLPTTIGSARTSFLLLFDLVGSSDLPSDAEEKAKSYGRFYDEVNRAVGKFLGGKIRKTIGDAVIATWDGTPIKLETMNDLLPRLHEVAKVADKTAQVVGCKGVRLVLHYGDYFFGLVGTSSFGQIDVIGRGIDEVCKTESYMKTLRPQGQVLKIVITKSAAQKLCQILEAQYQDFDYSSGLSQSNAYGVVMAWFHGGEILALKTQADLADVSLTVSDQAS